MATRVARDAENRPPENARRENARGAEAEAPKTRPKAGTAGKEAEELGGGGSHMVNKS